MTPTADTARGPGEGRPCGASAPERQGHGLLVDNYLSQWRHAQFVRPYGRQRNAVGQARTDYLLSTLTILPGRTTVPCLIDDAKAFADLDEAVIGSTELRSAERVGVLPEAALRVPLPRLRRPYRSAQNTCRAGRPTWYRVGATGPVEPSLGSETFTSSARAGSSS